MEKSSAFARELEAKYVDPDRVYSTDVRWWLGEAAHTDEVLLEQVQSLYDAGFRGVELCMQSDSGAPDASYAYGSEMWTHKWNLLMNKLLDLGMSVYLTSGTNWATSNVPGLDPSSQAAMQNLTMATSTVGAGQSVTTLQAPAANARRAGAKFVTAYAYRVTTGNNVDPSSYVNLKSRVTQGADVWTQNLNWTAPADGTYRIFSLWTQGTYQTSAPAAQPSYATNYFDMRGVQALRTFWEQHYLSDPALAAKIKAGDVQLFMDSLEITYGTGGMTWWSEDMATEFQKRKGYDITPYLFLASGVSASVANPYHRLNDTGTYRLEGDEKRRQGIINDLLDVQTQLYRERMLRPMKEWLNSVGIETRAQISYGKPLEISEPAMDVDYPEAENLNQYNQVDIFRLWTGAAKLENKVLSSETSATFNFPYNYTPQKHLEDAYSTFAAGFQRIIWHVWAADYGVGNYAWPGFNPFGNTFIQFHYFGDRNPGKRDYDEFNAHLGRVQQLMQTGVSRTDVGFIHQNWTQGVRFGGGVGSDNTQMQWQKAHQGVYYRSTELQDNGYTYDYFSPRFLFDDDVRFDDETKTIEQAGYKAVVLYQKWLDLEGAKRILAWAKRGLKVVVLEDAASTTPYNDGKDGALKKVTDELKTLSTVRTATVYDNIDYFSSTPGGYDDNVMEKLQELGVEPYTAYPKPNLQLLNQTREDADGNRYVYLYNYGDDSYHQYSNKPSVRNVKFGKNITTDVEVEGRFVPYRIDAWTGEVTELADYRWEGGRTIVPVDVDYNNIDLLAFEKVDDEQLHVLDTNADSSYATDRGVALRTDESGTVTAALSNGADVAQDVEVPSTYDITDWDLTVESWTPNTTAGDLTRTETIGGLTTTNRKTSTVKRPIDVQLDTLTTWNNIPEIGKNVSGTGHYEADFDWDAGSATGAYLDFGDTLEESMEVWINGTKVGGHVSTNPSKVRRDVGGVDGPTIDDGTGQQVPLVGHDQYTGGVSWTKPVADVSDYLVDGKNSIVIEYSSALANVQLSRGVIAQGPISGYGGTWWGYNNDYLAFGPKQAKIVPFVDVEYSPDVTTPPTTVPPSTLPPTTVPPTTVPPVPLPPQAAAKVRVRDKVRAGKMLKIRGRDLSVTKVSITLGGKKLGTAKVEDGRFVVTRKVPKNLSGKAVLRVLDRSGDVLVRTTVKVLRSKG
ncbi:hypothetical protein L2K70_11740 [Nocardioides KLBMP 9356]|uniref:Glycoside hydrolase n=1 Tax=Nocardioides potassii TaxID=2911371 RepID=A0ABS9HDS4_9ACTN|nr:glycosyl hydrolase [Nocardioides potassii]MCF6378276.1 hypothetical protein [Nocardioides potassii]